MIDINKIERRILDYIETNDEYRDTYLEDCLVILKELRAAREVIRVARVLTDKHKEWIEKHKRSAYVPDATTLNLGKKIEKYDEVIGAGEARVNEIREMTEKERNMSQEILNLIKENEALRRLTRDL